MASNIGDILKNPSVMEKREAVFEFWDSLPPQARHVLMYAANKWSIGTVQSRITLAESISRKFHGDKSWWPLYFKLEIAEIDAAEEQYLRSVLEHEMQERYAAKQNKRLQERKDFAMDEAQRAGMARTRISVEALGVKPHGKRSP